MKAGLATSVVMHAALIAFGLFTLAAPPPLDTADVSAIPVDLIPVDSLTRIQQGDRKAPMKAKAAPKKTVRADKVDNAEQVGESDKDSKLPPTPKARPKPVAEAAAEPPQPKPAPRPKPDEIKAADKPQPAPAREKAPEPKPVREAAPKPKPAPEQQVASIEKPPDQHTPDAIAKTIQADKPAEDNVPLPVSAPAPEARPQPPRPEAARTQDKKEAEKPVVKKAERRQSDSKDDTLDKVAALLNKEKSAGGGAKRSFQEAALGGDATTGGEKLTQSEMDALRGQIERCWTVPAGADGAKDLKVSIKFSLDRSGAISGNPQIVSGGGVDGVARAAAESARRAVLECAPYKLPAEKYSAWADVIVNFDPSDMF